MVASVNRLNENSALGAVARRRFAGQANLFGHPSPAVTMQLNHEWTRMNTNGNIIQSSRRNKQLNGDLGFDRRSLVRISSICVDWCPFVVSYSMDPAPEGLRLLLRLGNPLSRGVARGDGVCDRVFFTQSGE